MVVRRLLMAWAVAQSLSAIIGSADLQRVNLLIAELVDVIVRARIETWGREDGAVNSVIVE
jgi:hypothetical protein